MVAQVPSGTDDRRTVGVVRELRESRIPIAVFVLGDASFVAPLLLFQIIAYSPIALTILDVTTLRRGASRLDTITAPFKNPIVVAGAAGLLIALLGWTPPEA